MKCPMEDFLSGVLKGSPSTYERELAQSRKIYEAIHDRWNVRRPEQWRLKHILWFLGVYQALDSAETRYRYWLTVKKIMKRLEKEEDWAPRLNGPWTKAPR